MIIKLANYSPDFKVGFEDRMMRNLSKHRLELLEAQQTRQFKLRFSLSNAAALALFILWIYFQEQSLSVEHFLRLADLKIDDFMNLLVNY